MLAQKIKLLIEKNRSSISLRKSNLFLSLKITIFLVLAYFLFQTVHLKLTDQSLLRVLQTTFTSFHLWLSVPILLFFMNWSVEAMKWQFVVSKIEKISFYQAFKGTLTGVTLSVVTPAGIGDYIGRLLQLDNEIRFKAIGAALVANLSQLYVTIIWGSLSLFAVYPNPFEIEYWWLEAIWWLMPLINFLFLFMFTFHSFLLSRLKRNCWVGKIYDWIEVLTFYTYEDLLYLLCLSLFRYFIFTIQFVMILYFFDVSKNVTLLLLGVNFIFLLKTIVPSLFDLGVRESAAVFFFGIHGCSEELVLLASLTLWLINILAPAFIGLFFILKIKAFQKS